MVRRFGRVEISENHVFDDPLNMTIAPQKKEDMYVVVGTYGICDGNLQMA